MPRSFKREIQWATYEPSFEKSMTRLPEAQKILLPLFGSNFFSSIVYKMQKQRK